MDQHTKLLLHLSTIPLLLFFFVSTAAAVSFPDTAGTVVDTGDGYAVRLVETPESAVKTAEAVFTVDAPADSVFGVVTDYGRYPAFMPNIAAAEYLAGPADSAAWRFTFKVAGVKIRYSIRLIARRNADTCAMAWSYIEGSLKNTEGSWLVLPDDINPGRSLVRYRVLTEPGLAVPAWITAALTTRSIPSMIAAIREQAARGSDRN
jgi:ribosome-associated toxin RatA of RatAB toxin-antitoxin module